jgi:hypothetical protein
MKEREGVMERSGEGGKRRKELQKAFWKIEDTGHSKRKN